MTLLEAEYKWVEGSGAAFGAPGLPPRWTSAAKDTVATAYSASSRVWYTISHGILNEVYFPTIDRPQIRDMELLISDGETYFQEEKRTLKTKFEYIDSDSPAVRTVGRDPEGRYTLTKEIISNPHHPVIIVHAVLEGDEKVLCRLKVYSLLAPHLNGGGAGNSARTLEVAGKRSFIAWKDGISLAMICDPGFRRTSCGYVGTSDGWQDMQNFKMDWEFGSALDGNIALLGEVDLTHQAGGRREFTIALGFGYGHHAALSGAMASLATPFDSHLKRYILQWHRAASPLELAVKSHDKGTLLQISHNILLTHEDKTYSGAFIASASIPWGNHKSDEDLGGYHLVWTRDMVQTASALLACGRTDTALRALVYLACTQKPDGSFAQNFWVDGTPYWTGIQLDEVAFPIMLAWRLWKVDGLGEFDVFPFVERAAAFLVRYSPITQQERWEENAGYSPSTLAAVIAGLICAADIAKSRHAFEMAHFLEHYADWIEAHLDEWTVTDEGVLVPEIRRHYMRIRPPSRGEMYYREEVGEGMLRLSNRAPNERYDFEAREVVDAGFLELVRYGIRSAHDPLIVDSLKVIDKVLKVETPAGPCWRRYNHDGYGQRHDGGPYLGWGQGRAWPILTGERGHYELAAGHDPAPFIQALERFASEGGMIPEQIWDEPSIDGMEIGRPTGAAMPLVWAHAEYLKLLRSALDGRVFERISVVEDRYIGENRHHGHPEIFKLRRPLKTVRAGSTLRVVAENRFRLLWSVDGWATVNTLESCHVGFPGSFADVSVPEAQSGTISFTLFWPGENRWEGRNFDVEIVSAG
ncbi:Glucoamylase [Acidisarcina polymorpha]|uniref:Glucoamylase n=1 Tax=Acidisarcina polymorpha TaxID=2211140 RepID=A0A2Z5G664_9BACT|nr:glycoside hydrolase family 15 protein [Acidisarcina polymorpha]AXC14591.1 Glucoamylase [Acidisarcina polymorpha]